MIDPKSLDNKRQTKWKESGIYKVVEDTSKQKFYILDMFPYPSGAGLHVGHPKGFMASDAIARKKMLEGYNVLHPMGFDTFGLGTETYAIQKKMKPQIVAQQNIDTYIKQLEMFGCTYDRDRVVNTADPKYFKRTQRVFLKMYNHYYDENLQKAMPITDPDKQQRLAYIDYKPINRCPSCMTGLANEDLDDGKCERCASVVEQKPMKQRVLRITKYAQRLLDGLDELNREESMKDLERNRIGKSEGTQFRMVIASEAKQSGNENGLSFEVYTTRIDTVFGMSFVVMSPEHPLVNQITTDEYKKDVEKYKETAKHKTQLERTELQKDKNGQFTGAYAINPFNGQQVPIYIADYVLANYGTGVVMAVPAHDERDWEFAKKYNIPIIQRISPSDKNHPDYETINKCEMCYHEKGILVNSGEFTGLTSDQAIQAMQIRLEKNNIGGKKINYKIQDRVFSRQRYRGEPFPILRVDQNPKLEINFYEQKTRQAIINGIKTIETRALNPQEKDRYFGEVKVGDILKFNNKETGESIFVKIEKVYQRKNLEDLRNNEDKSIIEKMYTNKIKFTETQNFEDFSKGRDFQPGYLEKINTNGLVGREIQITKPQQKIIPLDEKDLPLTLPDVDNYEPTGTVEGPLAAIDDRVNVTLPDGTTAKRETNTMPGRAGSSWYRLRYMDPNNENALVGKQQDAYRKNVDVYIGGAEHVTRHMIYARFWQKFLYDIGIVSQDEPFQEYHYVGLIMGEDGRKMSKRRGNVVNPDQIINEFGADTLRTYEMFMGPFDQAIARSTNGIKGVKKFLDKIVALRSKLVLLDKGGAEGNEAEDLNNSNTLTLLHQTIKKLTEDIDGFRFNTAVSQLMILVNHLTDLEKIDRKTFETLVILVSPFAPHTAEELREQLGNEFSIFTKAKRPKYEEKYLVADEVTLAVQFNGKMRGTIQAKKDIDKNQALELIKSDSKLSSYITGEPKKIIYVQGKILNIIL